MEEPISQLVNNLEQATTVSEVDKAISVLAQIGEPVIPRLLQGVNSPPLRKSRRLHAMKILQKMGYPANKSAIAFMVGEASDINSPGWDIALSTLKEIGEPVLPEVRNALQFYSQDYDGYSPYIQGLCTFLEQMGSPLIDSLLPDILHLLEIGTDENSIDEYALWPIRKIGSPKANAAVPLLRERICGKHRERIKHVSIEALQDFDPSVVRPLVPILRECLYDESAVIRASASKILEGLGESLGADPT